MYERIQGNDMYNAGAMFHSVLSARFNNVLLVESEDQFRPEQYALAADHRPSLPVSHSNNYKLPVSYQYSFGVQQGFGAKSVLSVSYVGNQNRHQNDCREINLPDAKPSSRAGRKCGSGLQQAVPFLGFRSLRLSQNEANSHYNSLQARAACEGQERSDLQTAYTYAKAIDPTVRRRQRL